MVTDGITSTLTQSYGYDTASRLSTVTDGSYSATYAYHASSRLVSTVTSKQSTTTRLTVGRAYDKFNRLQSIQNTPAGAGQLADLSAYHYNAANQRVRRTLGDGSFWVYEHDALGQVKSGKRYWADGTPVAGQQFEYAFDDIGNRTGADGAKMGGDENGANLRPATYTPNLLNQYASRGVPGYVELLGLATAGSPVTVNGSGSGVYRRGEYFRRELPVANGSAPVWQAVSVSAGGTATTGNALVPAATQSFTYDLDGNLTADGLWNYTWDAENRLLKMESPTANPAASRRRLEFKYDALGRRIWKKVTNLQTSVVLSETRFLYDGWNLLAELSGASGTTTVRTYLWGTDLSGSLQGAGGVGGLLAVRPTATGISHFAGYDGNGNLTLLVDGNSGSPSAAYEFGPFGEPLRVTGPMGTANPFAFSTKFTDRETSLIYYGYRYYSPSLGRWLNRDPAGESSGNNLLGFLNNAPNEEVDLLGLCGALDSCGPDITDSLFSTLRDVRNKFSTIGSRKKKRKLCGALYDLIHNVDGIRGVGGRVAGHAWDILPLMNVGMQWGNTLPGFEAYGECGTGTCQYTVTFRQRCYYAGAANYALWGVANRLCYDEFPANAWLWPGNPDYHRTGWSLPYALDFVWLFKHGMNWIGNENYGWGDREHQDIAFTVTGYEFVTPPHSGLSHCDTSKVKKLPPVVMTWLWHPYFNGHNAR